MLTIISSIVIAWLIIQFIKTDIGQEVIIWIARVAILCFLAFAASFVYSLLRG